MPVLSAQPLPHLCEHVLVYVLVHEACERAEAAHRQQLDVARIAVAALLLVSTAGLERAALLRVGHHQVDKASAVRQDVPCLVPAGRKNDSAQVLLRSRDLLQPRLPAAARRCKACLR